VPVLCEPFKFVAIRQFIREEYAAEPIQSPESPQRVPGGVGKSFIQPEANMRLERLAS